jgi:hypothetical protein
MRMGFQTKNLAKGNITIDSSLRAYVYLGKYPIPSQIGTYPTIDFQCNGMPQVYFEVPYNITAQDSGTSGLLSYQTRTGINLSRLSPLGASTWRATLAINNANGPSLGLFLRVFGRLDLNPPAPPYGHGLMVRALDGAMLFYSGKRMLRLAGDTYDTQLTLPWEVPDGGGADLANSRDTAVNLPFSMQGKSIAANARGVVHWPYNIGGYVSDGQEFNQYDVLQYHTLYWANGNQLQVRRIATGVDRIEITGPLIINNSKCQTVYSRLSVIDNSQFP